MIAYLAKSNYKFEPGSVSKIWQILKTPQAILQKVMNCTR